MDNLKRFNKDYLVWVILTLAVLMSLFALYVTISGQKSVTSNLKNFQQTISGIQPINGKDVTVEQVAEAVARYCEQQNNCQGLNGDDGQSIQGPLGPQGPMGLSGISIMGPQGERGLTGATGAQGEAGPQGEQGLPGRTLELRCKVVDENTRRIEQKYTDAETWELLYYLSPSQRCSEEVENETP